MTERTRLTRTQTVLILQRQATGPILCGCGCGVELDPVNERIVDEHVIPRKQAASGHEGERDVLENRRFYRWPCAMEKTRADLAVIAKAKAQGGETGQYARRLKRGSGTIPTRAGGWPKGRKIETKKSRRIRQAASLNAEYAAKGWPLIDPRSPDYCYQPCENGLHVCGFHPDGNNFLTIANVRVRSADEARALFDRAKVELATPKGGDGDFVIDLQMDGECSEDFQMNRQMLDRLMSLASATHHTGAAA